MERTGQQAIYCECTPVVDAVYEHESDHSPVGVIVDAVAAAAGRDPLNLPPLNEFVDSEALRATFDRYDGDADAAAIVSFRIETWNVFVRADGQIRVCDATQHTDPEPVFEPSVA